MKSIPVKGKAKFDVKKDSADLNFKHGSESDVEKEKESNIKDRKQVGDNKTIVFNIRDIKIRKSKL